MSTCITVVMLAGQYQYLWILTASRGRLGMAATNIPTTCAAKIVTALCPNVFGIGTKNMATSPQSFLARIPAGVIAPQQPAPLLLPAKFPFQHLPLDCRLKVFSFLSSTERGLVAQVCNDWSELIRTIACRSATHNGEHRSKASLDTLYKYHPC